MIRACLWFLAGVYALQLNSFENGRAVFVTAVLVFFAVPARRRLRILLVAVSGLAIFLYDAVDVIDSRISPEFAGDSIVTTIRVVDFPLRNGANISLAAENTGNPRIPERIRLSWHNPPAMPRLGDVWQVELRLRRPRGSRNPGGFDYEGWLLRKRIGGVGYVVNGRRNKLLSSGELGPIERIRQRFVTRVGNLIPESERAAILIAIAVGARHLLSPQQWQRFARTGTSHLMAISGLHVGLAGAGGYLLASLLAGLSRWPGNQHFAATIAGFGIAAGYTAISGFGIPAQRASLMIGLAAAAVLAQRQIMPGTIVATACVAIVALTPLASMAPGFKLSFAAVMLLLWLARRYSRRTTASRLLRAGVRIRELGAVQVMLLFGLLPLTVLIFNRIAFMAPGVNLIAVPVFTLVTVPFALAGLLLDGAFEPVGDQALLVAGQSVALIESLITAASDLPWSDVTIAEITAAAWLYIAMPLAWAVLPPGWPGRSIAMVGIAALVMHEPHGPQDGCVDIDVLDVGQGLAIVAATRRHTVVFDTGPAFRGGRTAADTVVIPFLKFRGIDRIDALIVSHADLDHAGGVGPITSTIEVARLLTGEPLAISEAGARKCVAGDGDRHDGIDFYFIHPGRGSAYAGNDASCVLIIQSGSRRVMLTGDIERRVEEELVSARAIPSVDAVVVPHHGSRTSSSAPFVNALRPSLAIVSAGHDNRWGFPKQDVVSRWQAVGAEVLSTSTSGAISLRLCRDSGIVSVLQQRQASRRIWHE